MARILVVCALLLTASAAYTFDPPVRYAVGTVTPIDNGRTWTHALIWVWESGAPWPPVNLGEGTAYPEGWGYQTGAWRAVTAEAVHVYCALIPEEGSAAPVIVVPWIGMWPLQWPNATGQFCVNFDFNTDYWEEWDIEDLPFSDGSTCLNETTWASVKSSF